MTVRRLYPRVRSLLYESVLFSRRHCSSDETMEMKRGGTNRGRLFELAAVLAERLSVTELYLGGPALGSSCVSWSACLVWSRNFTC